MKFGDHVDILNKNGVVDKNNPNCEGRVTDFNNKFVWITNTNMPFMGTYNNNKIYRDQVVERNNDKDKLKRLNAGSITVAELIRKLSVVDPETRVMTDGTLDAYAIVDGKVFYEVYPGDNR
ncbi:MAG: hypothetical protein LC650_04545 [Actinobacteria bacterium]|nr:hypothetical protein [Actinomycetota bacterium]